MKKFYLLTKTLLVAVCLLAGANAWAYDVPSGYEIKTVYIGTNNGDGTVTANAAPTSTGWTSTIAGAAAVTTGTFTTGDVTEVARPNITITSATKIIGDAVGTGVYPTYVAGSTLQFDYTYDTTDATTTTNTKAFATYTLTDALTAGKLVMSADFFQNGTVNNRPTVLNFLDSDGEIVLSIYLKDGDTYQYLQYYYNGTTTAEGDTYGRSNMRKYRGFGIYDLCIDVETGEVSFIFDAITRGNASGNDDRTRYKKSLTITSIKDIKYVQVGTNNVVTGSYKLHIDNIALYTVGASSSSHAYTINAATAGGTIIRKLSSGYANEGDTYNYAGLPYVVDDGAGNFYYLSDAGVSGFTSATYTMGDEDETKKITYTLDEDIVYFNDCGSANSVQLSDECSGGNNGAWNTTGTISGLAAGTYQVTVKTWSKFGNYWRGEVFGINGTEVGRIAPGEAGISSTTVNVPDASTPITFWPTYNYTDYCDYILIKKTADLPSTEKIVVTSAGYATYVSNYNLDFTSATTKAYKVSVAEKGVATLDEVEQVPAKTPVLLYVAGGNGAGEAIPVTTDAVSAAAVTENDLVAGTGANVATTDGDYTNMILNNGSDGIGFYFANGQTVATNRAYLHIATTLAPDAVVTARGMRLVFAGDVTGINEAAATAEAAQKEGKFIENGKLVIVKNGKKFNANGTEIK